MSKPNNTSRVNFSSVSLRRRTSKSYYEPFEQKTTAVEISLQGRKSLSYYTKTSHKRTQSVSDLRLRKEEAVRRRSCACTSCGGIKQLIKMNMQTIDLDDTDEKVNPSILTLIQKKSLYQLNDPHEKVKLVQTLHRYESMLNSIKYKRILNVPPPSAPTLRKIITEKTLLQPIDKKVKIETITKRLFPELKPKISIKDLQPNKLIPLPKHARNFSYFQPTKSFKVKIAQSQPKTRDSQSPALAKLKRIKTLSMSIPKGLSTVRSRAEIIYDLYKDKSGPDFLKYTTTNRNKFRLLV